MKYRNISFVLAVVTAAVTMSSCTVPSGGTVSTDATPSSTSSLTSSDLTSVLISSNAVLTEAVSSVAEISSMVTSSKAVVSSKPTASSKATVSSKPTTTAKKPSVSSKVTSSPPANPWDKIATEADGKLVAERVIYWVNVFRREEGATNDAVPLPKMTKYAELRAQQLTTNFAHDTKDERAAAEALQYGDYIDDAVAWDGSTYPPYWDAPVGEAIGWCGGLVGESIDNDAEYIAAQFRYSKAHWGYVGAKNLIYLSVGCVAKQGYWYTCICTDPLDKDHNVAIDMTTYE